jgi:hypothetical protein
MMPAPSCPVKADLPMELYSTCPLAATGPFGARCYWTANAIASRYLKNPGMLV